MPAPYSFSTIAEQATISATGTRAQLASISGRTFFIRNAKASAGPAYLGGSDVTTGGGGKVMIDLQPGEGIFLDLTNPSGLWVVAASTATVYLTGLS